ncbi:short-chain dehydrogenase TIC 32, chloroplastic-like isoform X2 [Olea europaea var. sylvestris]|uniref:short-chain dehydrogenase TIC 32, chloroplastic-like isoform X2 n=1 Tax=Olea europaea var. sylvestris TaxID=158386 RepID=UPI000C1D684C|nr:short-chain dehydrogenase TIC 32, chloroplastic-like isoform X2 [Olea europaea var. sylvestris]
MTLIYKWLPYIFEILRSKVLNSVSFMKETLKYLAGITGPSGYGSKSTAEQVTQDCMGFIPSNLTAIVTGATSGIGAETARVLAKRGVRIIIPARDLRKAARVKEGLLKENPAADVILLEIDLSSFASIQRFCSEFLSLGLPLHILINNAGKYSQKLEFSEDKIEITFATNYLGHFLLTEMLLEKMVETAAETGIQGRIVNVSSVIHSWVKRDNFCFRKMLSPKSYNGTRAYAQSKLANILHAKELSRLLKGRKANVTINAVHPGIVKTGIIREYKDSLFFMASRLLKSISQGAATTCYTALSPQMAGVSGKYFADCNERRCSALANNEIEAYKLWKRTKALIHRRLLQPAS